MISKTLTPRIPALLLNNFQNSGFEEGLTENNLTRDDSFNFSEEKTQLLFS
jgi:hypothetical protein